MYDQLDKDHQNVEGETSYFSVQQEMVEQFSTSNQSRVGPDGID